MCQYCGWAGSPDRLEAKGYLMVQPLPREQIDAKATQYLKSKLHGSYAQASITEAKYVAIPFWEVEVWAHTWFNGYSTRTKTQTYYTGKQMQTRSYTVYVPTQGEWTDQVEFKTVARKTPSSSDWMKSKPESARMKQNHWIQRHSPRRRCRSST